MGRIFVLELDGRCYRCKFCQTYLALAEDLLSKAFHCRHGKAHLSENVVNIRVGVLEEKIMLSGLHTVADIFCCCFGQIIGWKYESVQEKSQKYKEGSLFLKAEGLLSKLIFLVIFMLTHILPVVMLMMLSY